MAAVKYITQKELADKLGVSHAVIVNWINRGQIKIKEKFGKRLVQDIEKGPAKVYSK